MRSRNVQFESTLIRPLTQMYPFFDGVDVSNYCTPKLLEISMQSGVFQVGETVVGRIRSANNAETNTEASPGITFRVAQSNHREGPFNSPTRVFRINPYTSATSASSIETFLDTPGNVQLPGSGVEIPSIYSSTSSILNVDTFALSLIHI